MSRLAGTTMRGAGGGGRRSAMALSFVAAVLLAVVDVLAALDDHEAFNRRRRHRDKEIIDKEIEFDFAGILARLESETPSPVT